MSKKIIKYIDLNVFAQDTFKIRDKNKIKNFIPKFTF